MAELKELWLAALTKNLPNAGTNDSVHLSVNDGNGPDILATGFVEQSVPGQKYLERAQATLFHRKLTNLPSQHGTGKIDPTALPNNAVRILIAGADQWVPQQVLVWGIDENDSVHPLVAEMAITWKLSAQVFHQGNIEGPCSIPLRRVTSGRLLKPPIIRRLLMVVKTESQEFAGDSPSGDPKHLEPGTNDQVRLRIKNHDGVSVTDHLVEKTDQDDLEPGLVNFYEIPVATAFRHSDLPADAISISLSGNDAWQPKQLFIFGLDSAAGAPSHVVPLVHLSKWEEGKLSADPGDFASKTTYTLKLEKAATPKKPPSNGKVGPAQP